MKEIIRNTLLLLNAKEKRQLYRLTTLNILLSMADIGSLALLLILIHFYTSPGSASGPGWINVLLLKQHFLVPVAILLCLFIFKNIAGYFLTRWQYHYVYQVASRLSRQGIFKFLQGNYTDYTHVPASVRIRQICHQPIEFCNYILSGLLQASTEIFITVIAITAILLFNAKIFLLLLLLLVPPVIAATFFTRRKLRASREHVKETSEKATQYLNEALESYIESNVYNKHSFFAGRYASFQKKLNDNLASLQIAQAIPSRFMEVFAVFGLFILIILPQVS